MQELTSYEKAAAPKNNTSFFKPVVQKKLSVGSPNDSYEAEADRVADQVMSKPGSSSQIAQKGISLQKYAACEQEEKLRMKPLAESITPMIQRSATETAGESQAPDHIESRINAGKGNGNTMDHSTKSFMENSFGTDFSNVKIHTGNEAVQMSRDLNAQAFAVGNDIYFNEGKYSPNSDKGKHLLAHELTHTIQQGHNKSIQRYLDANGTAGSAVGNTYRISDDLTTAVKVGYPNHDLYAEAGKAAVSNVFLAGVGSGIRLVEESSNFNVSHAGNKKTLKKITPKNTQNSTAGNTMKISDDCGNSCAVVVGGNRRGATHRDALTGADSKTAATTPSLMKAEIMKKMLDKWLTMPSTSAQQKTEINAVFTRANAKQLEINAAAAAFSAATTEADKKAKGEIYWAKIDEYGNIMMEFYNNMSESKREEVDKYLKINKFASPSVGQGYTMSSGGANYAGENTWNFHWGGVVMKSNDQKDTITLENYAVDGDEENERWDFAMYGTAAKKGQTFHEQHHDTHQHGDKPTTMTIEKT
ncbi:eCIS core domain-containing protein [Chryseobacterium populi]|uniref:eCIS core domain-containing protein n=1 Tax=Chryseobacterium populi TaxID=1144316 RepID=J2TCB2_9FLAO|nr:DUF4157 domain-containing protein [Chryseobacterium populi]EJL75837.1 hypothetical protein PMI13_00233 [Chryseobacterium populi]